MIQDDVLTQAALRLFPAAGSTASYTSCCTPRRLQVLEKAEVIIFSFFGVLRF